MRAQLRYFPQPRDYRACMAAMRRFTQGRTSETTDAIWQVTHRPVFTLGLAGKPAHLLQPGFIPVVRSDRGGQVTYHAPGQVILYCLFDLNRMGCGVRDWVWLLEQAVIDYLAGFHVVAERIPDRPGVYVSGAKIAALGLKVRRGRCYHGLSFNRGMNLEPFSRINPCGHAGMSTTDLESQCSDVRMPSERIIGQQLAELITAQTGHTLIVD